MEEIQKADSPKFHTAKNHSRELSYSGAAEAEESDEEKMNSDQDEEEEEEHRGRNSLIDDEAEEGDGEEESEDEHAENQIPENGIDIGSEDTDEYDEDDEDDEKDSFIVSDAEVEQLSSEDEIEKTINKQKKKKKFSRIRALSESFDDEHNAEPVPAEVAVQEDHPTIESNEDAAESSSDDFTRVESSVSDKVTLNGTQTDLFDDNNKMADISVRNAEKKATDSTVYSPRRSITMKLNSSLAFNSSASRRKSASAFFEEEVSEPEAAKDGDSQSADAEEGVPAASTENEEATEADKDDAEVENGSGEEEQNDEKLQDNQNAEEDEGASEEDEEMEVGEENDEQAAADSSDSDFDNEENDRDMSEIEKQMEGTLFSLGQSKRELINSLLHKSAGDAATKSLHYESILLKSFAAQQPSKEQLDKSPAEKKQKAKDLPLLNESGRSKAQFLSALNQFGINESKLQSSTPNQKAGIKANASPAIASSPKDLGSPAVAKPKLTPNKSPSVAKPKSTPIKSPTASKIDVQSILSRCEEELKKNESEKKAAKEAGDPEAGVSIAFAFDGPWQVLTMFSLISGENVEEEGGEAGSSRGQEEAKEHRRQQRSRASARTDRSVLRSGPN